VDAVYICRGGPNEELRYSIRSVIKNMPHSKIWVVGGKPDWYVGNYIEVLQDGQKYDNARANLKAIVDSDEISDDFILMNDDFFVINKIESVPTWYTGTIRARVEEIKKTRMPNSSYIRLLSKTNKAIQQLGIDVPLDYELHTPMVMNKQKLGNVINIDSLWRSTYGNMYGIGGSIHQDIKVYGLSGIHDRNGFNIDLKAEPFISGSDSSFHLLYNEILKDLLPNPSIYESRTISYSDDNLT
jgi:hypothetical protein